MACNTPIIASFDTDSDLADVIRDSGAGCCVEPENTEQLINRIVGAYREWKYGDAYNSNGFRRYVMDHASRDACVQRYLNVMHSFL